METNFIALWNCELVRRYFKAGVDLFCITYCLVLQLILKQIIFRIQGGELFERVIDEDFVLTERACACFMKQICEAMEYLHNNKVVHLDMKVTLMRLRLSNNFNKIFSSTARKRFVFVKKWKQNKNHRLWFCSPLRSQQEVASKNSLYPSLKLSRTFELLETGHVWYSGVLGARSCNI